MHGRKVSIIIPVYNVEEYLGECLESVVHQSYDNLEIILVDDGSTDKSGTICDDYKREDSRVKVIHKNNGGLVSARQEGIRHATGKYSWCVDSDDWIDRDAVSRLMDIVDKESSDLVTFSYTKEYTGFSEQKTELLDEGCYEIGEFMNVISTVMEKNSFYCSAYFVYIWSKFVKTDLLKKRIEMVDDRIAIGEDVAVTYPILQDVSRISVSHEHLYHYRVRKQSMMWKGNEYNKYIYLLTNLVISLKQNDYANRLHIEHLAYQYLLVSGLSEYFIKDSQLIYYPKIKKGERVVIYGKGVAASAIRQSIEARGLFNIVMQVDKMDIEKLYDISEQEYDYILIAITDSRIVNSIKLLLLKGGISESKIYSISKSELRIENLPLEVQNILEEKENTF